MSIKMVTVGVLGILLVTVAAGCGGDSSPTGPACAAGPGRSLDITLSAGDWQLASMLSQDPVSQDTVTVFSGTVAVNDTIFDVDPGDTVAIRLVFADPLVITGTVPPYLNMSLRGGASGGCPGVSPYAAVQDGGTWDVRSSNAGFYGASCSSTSIQGFWHNMYPAAIAKGNRLTCLTAVQVIPATFQGVGTIAPGQNLVVTEIRWYTNLAGDRRGAPFPVQAQ